MDKKEKKIINDSTIGMAQKELNQIHGEAASQLKQAYKGVRYNSSGDELGHLGRNLEDISKYKVNSNYKATNLKQQSGFSAELIHEARENKKAILSGDKTRIRTSDGLGNTNDMQYDHVKIDETGKVIDGSGSQMKFLKVSVDSKTGEKSFKVIDNLVNKKDWDRYDTVIDIPKEDYEEALVYAEKKYQENIIQYKRTLENNDYETAQKYKRRAEGYKNSKKRIRKSSLTQEEALKARINPKKFVRQEIIKGSHNAGIKGAKGSLIVGGGISVAQNIYSVLSEDKSMEEAITDVVATTSKAGVTGYVVGSSGTGIKSIMHSSENSVIRKIGTTSLPTLIATGTLEIAKSLKKYATGDIDEVELLEEFGEKGVGMITAGYCAGNGVLIGSTLGSLVLPGIGSAVGGIVGGFFGSILGYNISGIIYKESLQILTNEKLSYERRLAIEEIANRAIEENNKYKEAFLEFSKKQLSIRQNNIDKIFKKMDEGIIDNDVDKFINSVNLMANIFGGDLQFKNMEEFDEFMLDETTILKF